MLTTSPTPQNEPRSLGVVIGALALIVAVGVGVLVSSVAESADARFAGTTSNEGSFMSASAIDLAIGGDGDTTERTTSDLALDVENLVPGLKITRCIQVSYAGSIDGARLRLSGRMGDSNGLERFLDTQITTGSGSDSDCSDFTPDDTAPIYSGSLSEFSNRYSDFDTGLAVGDEMNDGDSLAVQVSVEVRSDNRAQGLASSFWLVFEVRP